MANGSKYRNLSFRIEAPRAAPDLKADPEMASRRMAVHVFLKLLTVTCNKLVTKGFIIKERFVLFPYIYTNRLNVTFFVIETY